MFDKETHPRILRVYQPTIPLDTKNPPKMISVVFSSHTEPKKTSNIHPKKTAAPVKK